MNNKLGKYYTNIADAARELGVSRMTIYRWLKAGRMTGDKVGKYNLIPKWIVELEKEKRK